MCYFSSFGRHVTCVCRADRTSINPKKNSVGIFNQIKLILVIDLVKASKSQLKRKIEFSN